MSKKMAHDIISKEHLQGIAFFISKKLRRKKESQKDIISESYSRKLARYIRRVHKNNH